MRQKLVETIHITKEDGLYTVEQDGETILCLDSSLTQNYLKKGKWKKTNGDTKSIEGGYKRATMQEVNSFVKYNGQIWRIWSSETRDKYPWQRYNCERETIYTLINFGSTIRLKEQELFPKERKD